MANALGQGEANFKIFFCTLLLFPFSVIFKRLPDNQYTLKNVYVIAVSAFYVFGVFELYLGLATLLVLSIGCYFITRYLRTSLMPWVNFVFLMAHLGYTHLHTQFFTEYDPLKIDILGAQMVLVMKLTAFGWNVHDAKQPTANLTEYSRLRVIKKHPNLLPYIGYVFFYASLLTGPAFDYVDYDKFIHLTLFDDVPDDKRPGKRKRRIPRSHWPALLKTAQGFFWLVLFLQASKLISLEYVTSGAITQDHGFVYRIFYLWALGLFHRLKYYCVWLIAEGACILCGIGYNGYDAEKDAFRWNRVQNIDTYAFETGQNVHECLEAWNQNTNKWLKNYVYLRIARKNKKPGFKSTLFTFATSAFWHGTKPGYYLTFVLGAFLQTVGKIYRRNFRPIFLEKDGKTPTPHKWVYDVVSYFATQLAFGFIVQPFVILDLTASLRCWATVYYYLPIVIFVTLFIFKGPVSKPVVAFLRRYHASYTPEKPSSKLTSSEAVHVENAVSSILEKEYDVPTLGVPPIDVLEATTKEEIDENVMEIKDAWTSFRARRGSIKDDDFEGLRDAYNNFTAEITEIFNSKKEEAMKKNKKE